MIINGVIYHGRNLTVLPDNTVVGAERTEPVRHELKSVVSECFNPTVNRGYVAGFLVLFCLNILVWTYLYNTTC